MTLGRPIKSLIRQNIVEILYYLHQGYGYQIAKIYRTIYPPVAQRSIYYQLKKGLLTKELEVKEIRSEHGDFSWGTSVEKIIYTLGPRADPKGNPRIKEFIDKHKR